MHTSIYSSPRGSFPQNRLTTTSILGWHSAYFLSQLGPEIWNPKVLELDVAGQQKYLSQFSLYKYWDANSELSGNISFKINISKITGTRAHGTMVQFGCHVMIFFFIQSKTNILFPLWNVTVVSCGKTSSWKQPPITAQITLYKSILNSHGPTHLSRSEQIWPDIQFVFNTNQTYLIRRNII